MQATLPVPRAEAAGRRRAFVLLVVAVLILHAGLLGGIDPGGSGREASLPPVVQVRSLPAVPAEPREPVVAAPVAAPAPVIETAPRPRPARPRAPRAGPPVALPPLETPVTAAAPEPAASQPAVPAETSVAERAAASEPAGTSALAESAAAEPELPVYRTQLPPAATLRYDLQRGRFGGTGELRWMPADERYELSLEGSIVGISVLTQISRGGFDAAGLAPSRFTDQRTRRPVQAANFQREAGKVSFSGPSFELPLRAGVQDRLSWMIQLAAIAAAEPQRLEPGAKVVLQVIGARGDASLWVFRCLGPEPLDTAAGHIDSVRFSREPRGPYDTGVEVWLDPARHHLPVRATTRTGAEAEGLDLRLREALIGG